MSKAGDSSVSIQNQKQPADQPERDLTLFGDDNGHNHNINSEQGSLSQAIFASINRLNNNFQHFTQQFEKVDGDEYDEANDNPNNVNILADIENIASSDIVRKLLKILLIQMSMMMMSKVQRLMRKSRVLLTNYVCKELLRSNPNLL